MSWTEAREVDPMGDQVMSAYLVMTMKKVMTVKIMMMVMTMIIATNS